MMRGFTILLLLCACPVLTNAQTSERRPNNSALAAAEDASVSDPGTLSIGTYSSYMSIPSGPLIAAPGFDVTLGLSGRVELSGFVGMLHAQDAESYIHGLDDTYVGAKFLLLADGPYRPGIALKPTLEYLGHLGVSETASLPQRENLVLPIIVGKQLDSWSLSYTGGYVTRGLAFSSVKLELDRWDRLTPVAILYASRATRDLHAIQELGLNPSRLDASAGLTLKVNPGWNLSVAANRTVGRFDENSSRLGISVGVQYTGRLWGKRLRPAEAP